MKSYLLVFDPKNNSQGYSNFLANVASEARKLEEIECLSGNVYMIPENRFLEFVSSIGFLLTVEKNRVGITYKYKCLAVEEDAQWLRFEGYQQ